MLGASGQKWIKWITTPDSEPYNLIPVHKRRGKVGMETLQRSSEIAGSRSAHLDDAFVSRQRYRLEKARDVLLQELGHALGDEEARPNRGSRGSSHLKALIWLEKRLRRRLRAVERALEKIEEGTYGTCDFTGEEIPSQRLEAIPEAVCTLQAQRPSKAAF